MQATNVSSSIFDKPGEDSIHMASNEWYNCLLTFESNNEMLSCEFIITVIQYLVTFKRKNSKLITLNKAFLDVLLYMVYIFWITSPDFVIRNQICRFVTF